MAGPDWATEGGMLRPGWIRCVNRTGRPERVLGPNELPDDGDQS
jgi:hypothetical protein